MIATPGLHIRIGLPVYLTILALALASCRVNLIADYDRHIHDRILAISKDVDLFYTSMLETEPPAERRYSTYVEKYVLIEVELRALKNINATRSNNRDQVLISTNVLHQWIKYKEQHKTENTLSNAKIVLNREYMLAQLTALEVAERAKQLGQTAAERNQ